MPHDFKPLTAVAVALGDRLKSNCRNRGMDINKAAARYVAERVLAHWHAGMGRSPFLVRGGIMFPQHIRPTEDADIVAVRRYTEMELRQGMQHIAAILRNEGIEIKRLKIETIDGGHGDPVIRLRLEAMCGTIRGNTHIDMSFGRGPFAFPQDVGRQELPSMIRGQPGLIAYVQSLEAAAADKWLAVLMQPETNYRVTHLADLLSFDTMEIDPARVAREIMRVCRHRGTPLSVCAPSPGALDWSRLMLRADSWEKLRAERGFEMNAFEAWESISDYWSRTHQALTRAIIAEVPGPGHRPTLVDRIAARRQPAPTYRPTP